MPDPIDSMSVCQWCVLQLNAAGATLQYYHGEGTPFTDKSRTWRASACARISSTHRTVAPSPAGTAKGVSACRFSSSVALRDTTRTFLCPRSWRVPQHAAMLGNVWPMSWKQLASAELDGMRARYGAARDPLPFCLLQRPDHESCREVGRLIAKHSRHIFRCRADCAEHTLRHDAGELCPICLAASCFVWHHKF